ncbi:hypothetical protein [Microbacterium hydrocarbonoxydans]|uniref:hypothetical protein n=1 Tax=Microbacterium hydrocarbonoxydans TaxID=273678 RepID=UPI00203F1D77|nr:hypothetical protein [Microbacterium hydrocarbonoxydans]MCM3779818.1 hypothetical protein [Microbacterium hydrocarbonoxydans]
MADREPSPQEMRTRLGLGAGLAIGMGIGVALGVSLDNWILGISIGVIIGLSLSVAIGQAPWRRRRGAMPEDPTGDDGTEQEDPAPR